jgi:thymidylate synthase
MKVTYIQARDINEVWFQSIDCLLHCVRNKKGRIYTIDHGSYAGQQRLELDLVHIHISHPGSLPLIPTLPPHMQTRNVPPPATDEYVQEYLSYLMTDNPPEINEQYTYGQRVTSQMERIIKRYKRNGYGSNQECIAVARPDDIDLDDPPCLRQIDTRIVPKSSLHEGETQALHFIVYFRSWDCWGGLPVNLAAIRIMQEYMAECIGVEAGEIFVSSKGLHLYDHVFNIASELIGCDDE